jgi:hypothetical protein
MTHRRVRPLHAGVAVLAVRLKVHVDLYNMLVVGSIVRILDWDIPLVLIASQFLRRIVRSRHHIRLGPIVYGNLVLPSDTVLRIILAVSRWF